MRLTEPHIRIPESDSAFESPSTANIVPVFDVFCVSLKNQQVVRIARIQVHRGGFGAFCRRKWECFVVSS